MFFPPKSTPFVLVVASPGDDVTPDRFVALYFDGRRGVQLFADIWHQPAFPVMEEQCVFQGKHGPIHCFVGVDTVEEFGVWLRVPLGFPKES